MVFMNQSHWEDRGGQGLEQPEVSLPLEQDEL